MTSASRSQRAWENARVERLSAQRQNATRDTIHDLLRAGSFQPRNIEWLAHRERYADAAKILVSIARTRRIESSHLLSILLERGVVDSMRLFRLCTEYDANSQKDLCASAAGRMALAASGRLDNWANATLQERAAFALGELVRRSISNVS